MAEVPATATPLAASETAPAFLTAWAQVFGGAPTRSQAEWLLAFLWNENAKGRAFIQHNWGNLSTSGNSGDYWRPPWFDPAKFELLPEPKRSLYRSIHERMLRGEEPSAFRAFSSHEIGAIVWLERLRDNFPSILEASRKNSAVAMQDAIFQSHYCTSPGCRTNAPSYKALRDEVRAMGLFDELAGSSSSSSSSKGSGGAFAVVLLGAVVIGGVAWAARTTK